MEQRLTLEQIRDFWTEQAKLHGTAAAASWSDVNVIDMEIREILTRLADGDRVLDVGCANGYSTIQYAANRKLTVRGVDYVPEMIEQARARLKEFGQRLAGSVEFGVGDIMNLAEGREAWDKVVVVRVVINLHDWDHQRRALRNCADAVKPGGLLLLSEATLNGWRRLNKFRNEWGLSDIAMPGFNQYLDQDQVVAELAPLMDLVTISNFASTYFVGSRVLKPLLAQALGDSSQVANPDMEFNRWFAQLPAYGDYGTQKLFVFRKK